LIHSNVKLIHSNVELIHSNVKLIHSNAKLTNSTNVSSRNCVGGTPAILIKLVFRSSLRVKQSEKLKRVYCSLNNSMIQLFYGDVFVVLILVKCSYFHDD
jgi:hypothetical protein